MNQKKWRMPWESQPRHKRVVGLPGEKTAIGITTFLGSAKSFFVNFKSISRQLTGEVHQYLMMGDFVQVRDLNQRMLNIASWKRLPTGLTKFGDSD